MRKLLFIAWSACLSLPLLYGQATPEDTVKSFVKHEILAQGQSIASLNGESPFWIKNNNSGRYDEPGANAIYVNFLYTGRFKANKTLNFNWEFESMLGFNSLVYPSLIQANVGFTTNFLKVYGGMEEEFFGFNDPELSLGNLGYSNNAAPMPKVVISTNGWQRLPVLGNIFSFKGYLAHGWFEKGRYQSGAFLHQKNIYLRVQALDKKLSLAFGLNHNAQWGGTTIANENDQPTGLVNYAKIFLASSGASDALETDQLNALGNHLGTYDLKGSYDFRGFTLANYWQFLWEDGSGLNPLNWRDGLVGLSLTMDNFQLINKFVFEIVRTTDQDAEKVGNDGVPFLEPDHFFNNGVYHSGWTYQDKLIGSPLFIKSDVEGSNRNVIQNMINAYNFGIGGSIVGIDYTIRYSSFQNHGTHFKPLETDLDLSVLDIKMDYAINQMSSVQIRMNFEKGTLSSGKNFGILIGYSLNFATIR
jgi:capsule assembly protein Wzi